MFISTNQKSVFFQKAKIYFTDIKYAIRKLLLLTKIGPQSFQYYEPGPFLTKLKDALLFFYSTNLLLQMV